MNIDASMFRRLLTLAVTLLMLGQGMLNGQSSPGESVSGVTDNVIPKKCCDYLDLIVQQQSTAPESSQDPTRQTITGLTQVQVKIANRHSTALVCRLVAESDLGGRVAYDVDDISVPASGSVERTIQIRSEDMQTCENWLVRLYCKGYPEYCDERPVTTGKCSQCTSCDGSTAEPSADLESDLVFTQPMPSFNGGMSSGAIKIRLKDSNFTGLAGAIPNVAGDANVNRNAKGEVTRVQCGTATMDLTEVATEQALLISLKDASGTEFRSTRISKVVEDGKERLRMDSTHQGVIRRCEQYQPRAGTAVLEKGEVVAGEFVPLLRESLTRTTLAAGVVSHRREVQERASAAHPWSVTSDVESVWEDQVFGWVKTKEVIDPDGAALTTLWTYYQPGETTGPGASRRGSGRLKRIVRYDGYEAFYTYGQYSQSVTTPYAGKVAGQVTTTTWDPASQSESVIITVGGQVLSKTVTAHTPTTESQAVYTSAGRALTTVTTYHPSGADFGGMPIKVEHPDSTLTTYSYTRNPGGGHSTVTAQGAGVDGKVVQGTRTTTTTNSHGTTILSKTEAIGYGTGSALFASMAVTEVDNLGRALTTAHYPTSASATGEQAVATGASWTTRTAYSCCGIEKETDMYGIATFYAYDGLKRQVKSNRLGVTTETVYKGLITESHRYAESVSTSLSPSLAGSASTLVSRSVGNLAGTLQESWSPDPTSGIAGDLIQSSSTTTSYKPAAGLSMRMVTRVPDPNNANQFHTQTTDSFLDGRTAGTSGDLSPAIVYHYKVNPTGEFSCQAYQVGSTYLEATGSQSDWAGRAIQSGSLVPATGDLRDLAVAAMGPCTTHHYNSRGQMTASVDPDLVTTLYDYNAEGELIVTAMDLDRNSRIDYGSDTVFYTETYPALADSSPVFLTIRKVWQPGDTDAKGGTVLTTSLASIDGLSTTTRMTGVDQPISNTTVLSGSGNWIATSTDPDGTRQVDTYSGGRLSSLLSSVSQSSVSYAYDGLNRPVTVTDSRTGATTTTYLSDTADIVASITDSGKRSTSFAYDILGRCVSTTLPDGTLSTSTYTPRGELASKSGSQTYPVSYLYDHAGRQVRMTTHGTAVARTHWIYSPERGWLVEKNHEGENDDGAADADYTYTAAGRLASRTWERGVVTAHAYDKGGRLVSTTYSNDPQNTPGIVITYDCLGRQLSQSNGLASCSYRYSPETLQLVSETIAYDLDGNPGADFTRVLDHSHDSLQRPIGFALGAPASAGPEVQASYAYDSTTGRLASVGNGSDTFSYTYAPNSSLLASITGPVHSATNSWEPGRNILAIRTNAVAEGTVSRYDYRVNPIDSDLAANAMGQRVKVAASGSVFTGSTTWAWSYDSLGQLIRADSNTERFDRAYEFDAIGNRLRAADSLALPTAANYVTNALNQYTATPYGSAGVPTAYDADGNMTNGPLPADQGAHSSLQSDAENRLVQVQVGSNGPLVRYSYDSQGRSIARTIGTTTTLTIYDGWNPIAEYSFSPLPAPSSSLTRSYTWGLDLSGSMEGAGGVGGLLAVTVWTDGAAATYYPTYDGNGNVSEYLDRAGACVAHYEYDPFGRTVASSGTLVDEFSHRFSTKPLDGHTGLYSYGYRHYDPDTGRWINRDPIEEDGGENTYQFVYNDAVNWIDVLGMMPDHVRGLQPKRRESKPTPIKDLPIPVRKAIGIPVSILSGDAFGPLLGKQNYKKGQCEFLVTINGIWNLKTDWEKVRNWIHASPTYRHVPTANYVPNPTTWIGDVLAQILGNEFFLAIDITPRRAAKAIELAAAEAKKNKCCCWYVHVVGHSQGTMIADMAFALLSKEIREHVTFVGLGGERFVEDGKVGKDWKDGRSSVWNIAHVNDPVPWVLGNGPVNFTRNEKWHPPGHAISFGDAKKDRQGFKSHSFRFHYKDYMDTHAIRIPNCKGRNK